MNLLKKLLYWLLGLKEPITYKELSVPGLLIGPRRAE